jgi:hypothetical protein
VTNIIQDGAAWLGGQLKDHAGVDITYRRGSDTVAITATATLHEYQIVDQDGIATVVISRDYIVHAADLVLDGAEIAPRAGDQIVETIRSVATTFEVMPLGERRECELVDQDGLLLLIHTKKVA